MFLIFCQIPMLVKPMSGLRLHSRARRPTVLWGLQVGWSVEGLERIQRHARELLPRLFPLQADCYETAAPSTLQPVSLIA